MRPSEKFGQVIRIARLCAAACGSDVFHSNYKINSITYLVIFCITVYFIFSVYTVQLKFAESWTYLLESFCMVGSVFQGISKLLTAICYQDKFRKYLKFLETVYAEYEEKNNGYVEILSKCVSRVRNLLKSVLLLYVLVVGILVSTPLLFWAFTGRRLFVMQFYLPFLDIKTIHGYLLTIGMQSTCLFFGAFGNFAGDIFLLMFFTQPGMLVDIFEMKSKELNELASEFGNPKVGDKLKDVIEWHQAYSDFIDETEIMFYWMNFTQITTSALSIVLTLVIIFVGDWPGSYAYICICFAMMYLYCGMGTVVEIANERIVDEIYAIHWYNLTVPQQKAIRYMLMKAQSPKQISVGGVAPLSVSTGLQVTKTVYSVFMMLLNFFD